MFISVILFFKKYLLFYQQKIMVLGKERAIECLAKTPIAFIGTITSVIAGISTRSMPPINHYKLKLENIRTLRGSVSTTEFTYHQLGAELFHQKIVSNLEDSDTILDEEQQEQKQILEPATGSTYLACSCDGQHIRTLVELDNDSIEQLIQTSRIPLGWIKQSNERYESPWQYSHAKYIKWYENPCFARNPKCIKSGRPLLMTTDDISFTCEPIKTDPIKEYQNPDGDGLHSTFPTIFIFI